MTVYDYKVATLEGEEISLSKYQGKVLIIVNTASKCGLAPQLEGLESLYKKYKDQGLEILGFPCNQFLGQEPLEGEAIKEFCQLQYDVTFPLFDKIKVNGKETHPLYHYLKEETGGKMIKWNYTKFLIDRQGEVTKRFSPRTTPDKMVEELENLL
jgi:glutathione peroxidase